MKPLFTLPVLFIGLCLPAVAQTKTPSEQMLEQYRRAQIDLLMAGFESQSANLSDDKAKAASAQSKIADNQVKAADALTRGVKYPEFSAALLGEIVARQETKPVGASAVQITQLNSTESLKAQILIAAQNATIIEQNKQMLALLQKIADKK